MLAYIMLRSPLKQLASFKADQTNFNASWLDFKLALSTLHLTPCEKN